MTLFKSILANRSQSDGDHYRTKLVIISEHIVSYGKKSNGQLCFFKSVFVLESTRTNDGDIFRDDRIFYRPVGIKSAFPNLRSVFQDILVICLRLC